MRTHESTQAPILSVRDISKRFGGVQALAGVSVDFLPGEVHCLAGENGCGKSTLIKVIAGAEIPDAGEITIDGETYREMETTLALTSGIQVIYQDFSLFPNLTVAENIVLTAAVAGGQRIYRERDLLPRAHQIVEELGLDLDLNVELAELSVADRQLTAICRALINDARVLIMDEPTTALTHNEVTRLFTIVERLRARGVALVFVSHKLDEILEISQRVTIMRSGKVVVSGPVSEFDRYRIAEQMTGKELDENRIINLPPLGGDPVISVKNLTLTGAFRDVSFDVQPGEILGITGLLGSGRTEIVEAIFGVQPAESGTIHVSGKRTRIRRITDAVKAGIGYVPEDRLTQGLFLDKSIADNITAGSLNSYRGRTRLLNFKRIGETINHFFTTLAIKAPDAELPVRSLSGGNAQRVVLAKWLATNPKLLILNGPTVGVDVGSKSQILHLLREQAEQGMSVIVISDDAQELVACAHRVLVVTKGVISAELAGDEVTIEGIHERMAA